MERMRPCVAQSVPSVPIVRCRGWEERLADLGRMYSSATDGAYAPLRCPIRSICSYTPLQGMGRAVSGFGADVLIRNGWSGCALALPNPFNLFLYSVAGDGKSG